MTENHKKTKTSLSTITLVIIGIFTPAAYLIGALFYQGLMFGYGIDPSNFPLDINNTYVYFYIAALHIIITVASEIVKLIKEITTTPHIYYILLFLLLIGLIIFSIIKASKNIEKIKNLNAAKLFTKLINYFHWKNNDATVTFGFVSFISGTLLVSSYAIFVIAILWWGIPYASYANGKKIAKENIIDYREKGCYYPDNGSWNSCTSVVNENNEIIHEGISIAEGNNKIAILDKTGTHIFNLQNNYTINRQLKTK